MLHRIRKQVMDLTISGRLDAFRTQHLAGPFYYRQLLPALEKIFNELSHDDEMISLDKLELDLGIIPVDDLEGTVWNGDLEKLLRDQVSKALQEQRKDANVQRSTVKENTCNQWLFYTKHGYLNWNGSGFDEKALAAVLEILATDYALVMNLRKLLQNNQHAAFRILREHAESFLISLIEILTATAHRDLLQAVDELVVLTRAARQLTGTPVSTSLQLRQEIWLQLLRGASSGTKENDTSQWMETILLSEKNHSSITIEKELLATLPIVGKVWTSIQEKRNSHDKQTTPNPDPVEKEKNDKKIAALVDQQTAIDENGIFISNAGLVLLHPFLSIFFKRLELLADNKFYNLASTEKAVHLLHYLATGETDQQEHELVTAKILCALPLHHALKEIIVLSEEEKQEADDLLSVVIEKWEKLGSVSIEALRENFLQRPGKLYTKNDQYFLQVENGTLDVLLDFLPWTLSIVKLPWMKDMLRIEWR